MEKKQTAMQQLIAHLKKYEEVLGVTATMTIDKATELLSVEKSNIVEAWQSGNRHPFYESDKELGEDYYNQTFSSLT